NTKTGDTIGKTSEVSPMTDNSVIPGNKPPAAPTPVKSKTPTPKTKAVPKKPVQATSIGQWIKQLGSLDATVRSIAEQNLIQAGAKAVTSLTHALSNLKPIVRQSASRILGQIGAPAKSALPELSKELHDKDPDTRQAAAFSIIQIDSAAA